jgi:hypothetical protein
MDFRTAANEPQDHSDDQEIVCILPNMWGTVPKVELYAAVDAIHSGFHSKRSATWQAKAKEQFKLRTKAKHLSEKSWPKYWAAWREAMQQHIANLQVRQSQHN